MSAPAPQVYVVVMYGDAHCHVAPLFPANLDNYSAIDLAKVLAFGEGRATNHCREGERIMFVAVEALTTGEAVAKAKSGAALMHGSFTL